jgi:hypothetical protein
LGLVELEGKNVKEPRETPRVTEVAKTDPSELARPPLFVVDPDQPEPLLKQTGTCRIGPPIGKIFGLLHPKDTDEKWYALEPGMQKLWGEMDTVVQDFVVLPAVKDAVRKERELRILAENKLFEIEEERRKGIVTRMVRAAFFRLQDLFERWENRGT